MNAQEQAWLDQEDAKVNTIIRRHGWMVTNVGSGCSRPGCDCGPSETPYAYTVGLFGMGHPELLIFGLSPAKSMEVLNAIGETIRAGDDLIPGQLVKVPNWNRKMLVEDVPNPGDIIFGANRHYWRPAECSVPALQLTYTDSRGNFPWDSDYRSRTPQPRPGSFRA